MRAALPVLALVVLCLAPQAEAGDYQVTVADDPDSACAKRGPRPSRPSASWPVVSGAEFAADVGRYFAGQETNVVVFAAAFANGHVTFCGEGERSAMYQALVRAAIHGPAAHPEHLSDYGMIWGSRQLAAMLDEELGDPDLTPPAAQRLRRMREAVDYGMRMRHQGPAS